MRWKRRGRKWLAVAVLTVGVTVGGPATVRGQAFEETGTVATGLLLRQLEGVKRVLMIGAHPDDEDTSLLTTLARGWGAETAYLSLTRGDGGQNLIGSELWEGLGVVRTGELQAARRLDGGRQFFARAFDYGFSKSADEALAFWPRNELLADVVWVIRNFRPQVVVSVWSGTPRDGHGQHQASGIIAREAFGAAADPERFPDQLEWGVEAWAADKLYESARRLGGRGGPSPSDALVIETGGLDPLLGRSLYQLSMESRSQHRSQQMGAGQPPGPRSTGVRLIESRVEASETGIFSGVDTTLVAIAGAAVSADLRAELDAFSEATRRAREAFGLDLSPVASELTEALRRLDRAYALNESGLGSDRLRRELGLKIELLATAIMAAGRIELELRASDDLVVPGQVVQVDADLWNGGPSPIRAAEMGLNVPPGWGVSQTSVTGLAADGSVSPGSLVTWTYDVRLPRDAEPSRLYYLEQPRDGDMYRWPDDPSLRGLPRNPPAVTGTVAFDLSEGSGAATRISAARPWRYVGVDPAEGEFRRAVLVVPSVSVQVTPQQTVWPQSRTGERTLSVVVRTQAETGTRGEISLVGPPGWSVEPATQPVSLESPGSERTLVFDLVPAALPDAGTHRFSATVTTEDGSTYTTGYAIVDYEHIERAVLFDPAEARVTVIPVVASPGLRVGYIMGSGDDGPEAIRQLGVDVQMLGDAEVREGVFASLDVIVLGVRALETRPDVRAATQQLRDFANRGGVVVAQYARGGLEGLAPLPIEIGRDAPRVVDENAPVRILEPEAPVFTTPNRIGPSDFDGWVQERGLYFASEWDEEYVPLLELHDAGEAPAQGSLLVTSVGEGVFVYTALSFFRQWVNGVPGAYRLFANLISIEPTAWKAYAASR